MRISMQLRSARSAQTTGWMVAYVLAPMAGVATLFEFAKTLSLTVFLLGCVATVSTYAAGLWSIRYGKERQREIELAARPEADEDQRGQSLNGLERRL